MKPLTSSRLHALVPALLLATLLSCGGLDYPSLFLRVKKAPDVGAIDTLVIDMLPAVGGDYARYSETLDASGLDLDAGWVLELRVAEDSPFAGRVYVAITGHAAGAPIASYAGEVTLSAREQVEVVLQAIAESCDADGDGFKPCEARPECCNEIEKRSFNDPDDGDPAVTPVSDEPLCRDATDSDADGFSDCAEALADPACPEGGLSDATIYPGAPERCDEVDNDCDGLTDEGMALEGHGGQALALGAACGTGACAGGVVACDEQGGVRCSTAGLASPEGGTADGVDDDCNGLTDEGTLTGDSDGDGFTDEDEEAGCASEPGAAFDASIHPGASERCGDGVDQDCDGLDLPCDPDDGDQDGVPADLDCDDDDAMVHPGAPEQCGDGVDQDCDGLDLPCDPALDGDDDGYLYDVDCDDSDAQVYPGAPERCNDEDDDCDLIVDDGNPLDGASPTCGSDEGECVAGVRVCAHAPGDPAAVVCLNEAGPVDEGCDGLDNDCDGDTDEGAELDAAAAGCLDGGVCDGLTLALCEEGAWTCDYAAAPGYEAQELSCDGLDNDCDGLTDEGLEGPDLAGCLDLGVCDAGFAQIGAQCVMGGWVCDYALIPYYEALEARCDELDNDCDGLTDEGLVYIDFDGAERALGEDCGAGVCAGGVVLCDPATTTPSCNTLAAAHDELCNALDDDCDGDTDEGFTLDDVPVGAPCDGVGACGDGVVECLDDQASTTCSTDADGSASEAQDEVCDGLDNDCDGDTDEELDAGAADNPCLSAGVCAGLAVAATCVAGEWTCDYAAIEAYEHGLETRCDGLDNDCDGDTDEDMRYAALRLGPLPLGAECDGVGACGLGVVECGLGAVITCSTDPIGSASEVSDEICNGLDDDCDGDTDEGFRYVELPTGAACQGVGECGEGVVECASLNQATCSTNADGSAPQVDVEICDQLDNDCDGLTDEDLNAASPDATCPRVGECTITNVGAACVEGLWQCDFSAVVHYEDAVELSCDALDNDCDGQTDEDFSWTDPITGEVLAKGAACGAGACDGGVVMCTEAGDAVACSTEIASDLEFCDGVDNDCDGLTDEGMVYVDPVSGDQLLQGDACQGRGECGAGLVACSVDGQKVITCSTNPGGSAPEDQVEVCDALDNDCDGDTDEELTWDGIALGEPCDGVGACGQGLVACAVDSGLTTCSTMPNGDAPEDTPELCDGEDDDCDGLTDEDLGLDDSPCETVGVCVGVQVSATCAGVSGWACDYSAVAGWQANDEAGRCDGQDNDCDGLTDEDFDDKGQACDDEGADLCADGILVCAPDGAALVCEGDTTTAEVCGGGDEDCDGLTDEEDAGGCVTYYRDLDQDGHGDGDAARCLCAPDADSSYTATAAGDCDDALASGADVHTGAPEVCNGVDDDCDGFTDAADDGLTVPAGGDSLPACELGAGVCAGATKPAALCDGGAWLACDEAIYLAHHAAYQANTESSCDGLDNDCDGATDEDFSLTQADTSILWGVGKPCGLGACADGLTRCLDDQSTIECSTEDVVAVEVCDGLDNDCNGFTDAGDDQLLTHDIQACALTLGVCDGATRPATLCAGGSWQDCDLGVYLDHDDAYQQGFELSCDDQDNDCDGATDEDFPLTLLDGAQISGVGEACGTGACAGGTTECSAGGGGVRCPSEDLASEEICDGLDNDCDGLTDGEDDSLVRPPCEDQDGVCQGALKRPNLCQAGAWQVCGGATYDAHSADHQAGAELSCDGLDNDCDGFTDEDFTLTQRDGQTVTGVGQACGVGTCTDGLSACDDAGDGVVCPSEALAGDEVCDGLDNDCDGLTDADDADLTLPPGEGGATGGGGVIPCEYTLGVCEGASKPASLCQGGAWAYCGAEVYLAQSPGFFPDDETCDGLDNDCDGQEDEDYVVTTTSCGVGACVREGERQCHAGDEVDTCAAGVGADDDATCDGLDDDCDGSEDEDYVVEPTSCGVGACVNAGERQCQAGVEVDTCAANAPITVDWDASCDGVDDDCDGGDDEDYTPGPSTCGLGVCASTGEKTCVDGGELDSCVPGDPITAGSDGTCDGIDDDCDGSVDENYISHATTCGLAHCFAVGATYCEDGAVLDSCTPDISAALDTDDDTCDHVDDDCDGLFDEDYVAPATTCGQGACATSGVLSCMDGALTDTCQPLPAAGSDPTCDGLDDDCDGSDDEDYASEVSYCGLGYCTNTGSTHCTNGGVTSDCTPRAKLSEVDTTCDLVDDDCDGQTDDDVLTDPTTCGQGACAATGAVSCVGGDMMDTCVPGQPAADDATCDGVDDDCDGETDEDYQAHVSTCGSGPCAKTGYATCDDGVEQDDCEPDMDKAAASDPSCNDIDEDCDGDTDDDYDEVLTSCGYGPCEVSAPIACVGGVITNTCVPDMSPALADDATCDNVDDDCDGLVDEDYVAPTTSCGVGACATSGVLTCVGGTTSDTCAPLTPTEDDSDCDDVDDDCDGETDEHYVGAQTTCGVGACATTGAWVCDPGASLRDTCAPLAAGLEACNSVDDDCDGSIDEGLNNAGCTTYYKDGDGDGWGDAGDARCYCSPKPGAGYANTKPGDCCDADANANPNQTTYYTSARTGCGGFDYNCDGSESKQWDYSGDCGGFDCDHDPGWDGSPPACGAGAKWITSCSWPGEWEWCHTGKEDRTQPCR